MPKTILKNQYLSRVAFVNDQLCYFNFADEEVRQIIEKLKVDDPAKMTTEIFCRNKYAKRIQVRFDDLLGFRQKSKATIAGMSLSFGVEHLLYYLEDVRNLKLIISSVSESPKQSESPEERMLNNLEHWGITKPNIAIIKTIKYLRLRRNHIVHARDELTSECDRFIRNESHHLKTYWSPKTSLDDLDFADKNIGDFTDKEVYTCMKLLRVCLEEIDTMIASTLSESDLIRFMMSEITRRDKKLRGTLQPLSRKVRRCMIDFFDVKVSSSIVQATLKSVLENEAASAKKATTMKKATPVKKPASVKKLSPL